MGHGFRSDWRPEKQRLLTLGRSEGRESLDRVGVEVRVRVGVGVKG